jgi:hypothetical protein
MEHADVHDVVYGMEDVWRHYSIPYADMSLRDAFVGMLVISLKNIDNRTMYQKLVQDTGMDWNLFGVENPTLVRGGSIPLVLHNRLGSYHRWIICMQFMVFEPGVVIESPILRAVTGCLTKINCFMIRSSRPAFDAGVQVGSHVLTEEMLKFDIFDVYKLFILINIAGMPSSTAISLYCIMKFPKRLQLSEEVAQALISMFTDHRFENDDYVETLLEILRRVGINGNMMQQCITEHDIKRAEMSQTKIKSSKEDLEPTVSPTHHTAAIRKQ